MQESILAYRRLRYLWVASALAAIAIIAYAFHAPSEPPNGGTWLGYTLGGIGAALILVLAAFGRRKRAYSSRLGSVQGWLSAHVYLGIALVVIVTLHAGFQFGWNVHTLSYVLTCVVVGSGVVGVWFYLRYPGLMSQNRAAQTREQMLGARRPRPAVRAPGHHPRRRLPGCDHERARPRGARRRRFRAARRPRPLARRAARRARWRCG